MQDIGRILREMRVARGFEIDDVAKITCISPRYLRAMEEGRFNLIPNVFDRGYLKIYACLLNIDAQPLLALLEKHKAGRVQPQMQVS